MSNPPASKGAITRKICKAITGTDGLIIIDEADHLGVDGFEQLRAIQDATKIGMVLIGNPDGLEKVISNTYSNKDLTRLRSRVARFKRIGRASIADVDAIAKAWGLGGKEELAAVQEITSQPGALRILSHTINQAWITAQGMGQGTLSAEHIKATYKSMYGNQKKQLKGV
ncbi:Mu B transposition protein, C terminal [Leminorella grimontii]|uniref:AAA family ATPase n=1 Tax=Leminorella grimontii TaxID=82981 RepID=UPI0010B9C6DA|nr:Mu B transposition protein, C terminal [Leminorella grimontii]